MIRYKDETIEGVESTIKFIFNSLLDTGRASDAVIKEASKMLMNKYSIRTKTFYAKPHKNPFRKNCDE